MANSKVFISDLKVGKCSSVVEARMLHFWELRNVKRGGKLMWLDMLLVDVNVSSFPDLYIFGFWFCSWKLWGFDFCGEFSSVYKRWDSIFIILYSDLCSWKFRWMIFPAQLSLFNERWVSRYLYFSILIFSHKIFCGVIFLATLSLFTNAAMSQNMSQVIILQATIGANLL